MTEPTKTQPEPSHAWIAESAEVRNLLLTLWRRARMDWSFVSSSLADAFRQKRAGSRERRAVSECLYGMIRHHRRLGEALDRGGWRGGQRAPDLERIVAYLVLEEGLGIEVAARLVPELDWAAVASVDEALDALSSARERVARRHSFPDWLAKRLHADWGDSAESLAEALGQRAPMTVRVNTLKGTREALQKSLAEQNITTREGRFSSTALIFETRVNLFSLPEFKAGLFEAQDEGSQLIADLVAPPPKGNVVDLCAGAGGKTLALAALLQGRGRLLATDPFKKKLDELRRRSRRAGASNVQAAVIDAAPRAPWPGAVERWVGKAERVLVDAPCTGVGSLRRNPEARWRLTPEEADALPAQQLEICERALSLLAPGGRLIYATCTVLSGENDRVVEALLERHRELELVPVKEVWGRERAELVGDGDFLRTVPHEHGCDGFFAAIVRRKRS